jgi:hypothetical protein
MKAPPVRASHSLATETSCAIWSTMLLVAAALLLAMFFVSIFPHDKHSAFATPPPLHTPEYFWAVLLPPPASCPYPNPMKTVWRQALLLLARAHHLPRTEGMTAGLGGVAAAVQLN